MIQIKYLNVKKEQHHGSGGEGARLIEAVAEGKGDDVADKQHGHDHNPEHGSSHPGFSGEVEKLMVGFVKASHDKFSAAVGADILNGTHLFFQESEQAGVGGPLSDIDRDGAMAGVNVAETARLAEALKTPVIASGGVSSLDDLKALKAVSASGISGAISGRALYDGAIDPAAALTLLAT